jgi:hypothetical protein
VKVKDLQNTELIGIMDASLACMVSSNYMYIGMSSVRLYTCTVVSFHFLA